MFRESPGEVTSGPIKGGLVLRHFALIVQILNEAIDLRVAGNNRALCEWIKRLHGDEHGQLREIRRRSVPSRDRSMGYMVSIDATWRSPKDDEANIAWARDFWQRLTRLYLNFPGHGEDGEALVKSTFGANNPRLVAIKRKYDPHNRFRFNQNIRPDWRMRSFRSLAECTVWNELFAA
jgi:FAD/FMN-containing dehydrogenase